MSNDIKNVTLGPNERVSQLRFSSGHDFSRAVSEPNSVRLQPLRSRICSHHTDSNGRSGFNVAQVYRDGGMVFRPEASDSSDRAAAPPLPTPITPRVRKFADPSLTKCKWSRPLLIDSDPPTEFDATYSKQTTEKFLTEARTHISDFRKSPNSSFVLSRRKSSKTLCRESAKRPPISQLLAAPPRPFLPKIPAPTIAFLPGSDQNIENDVTSRKQRTENFLPGATTTHCRIHFSAKKTLPAAH